MTAHWGLLDPAKAEGTEAERTLAFADTMRMLNQRIGIFVSLPLDRLSKLSLKRELDAIGRTRADAPSKLPA
jgi:arsenate reductase (thioredoxin)